MSKKKAKNKKFVLFVKTLDEEGFVKEDECGFLRLVPKTELVFSFREATPFVEKKKGHGSFSDWKEFFESEHPNWRINETPTYVD